MKYVKPEIAVLGRALEAVQGNTKNQGSTVDSESDPRVRTIPAYEADE